MGMVAIYDLIPHYRLRDGKWVLERIEQRPITMMRKEDCGLPTRYRGEPSTARYRPLPAE